MVHPHLQTLKYVIFKKEEEKEKRNSSEQHIVRTKKTMHIDDYGNHPIKKMFAAVYCYCCSTFFVISVSDRLIVYYGLTVFAIKQPGYPL